jgi:hypothetical protein
MPPVRVGADARHGAPRAAGGELGPSLDRGIAAKSLRGRGVCVRRSGQRRDAGGRKREASPSDGPAATDAGEPRAPQRIASATGTDSLLRLISSYCSSDR